MSNTPEYLQRCWRWFKTRCENIIIFLDRLNILHLNILHPPLHDWRFFLDTKSLVLILRFPNTVFDTSIHSSQCWPSTVVTLLSIFPPVLHFRFTQLTQHLTVRYSVNSLMTHHLSTKITSQITVLLGNSCLSGHYEGKWGTGGIAHSGVHKFSKNLAATSKFWASEGWHEASSILMTHKY